MHKLLIALVALSAYAATYELEFSTNEQWDRFMQDKSITPANRGLIVSSEAKKAIQDVLNQMQCGWPEYGIPPLAPYTNPELSIEINRSAVDSLLQFIQFRLDGLNKMEVKKMKVTWTVKKKVQFHFNFKELLVTAKSFNTDTLFDLMQQLGISIRYEGSGPFEFALENLAIIGQFKYKMPMAFGSIKIYDFEATLVLGGVRSNIQGLPGTGRLDEYVNDQLEYIIPTWINGHQKEISDYVENIIVPRVNEHFEGQKVWSFVWNAIFGGSNGKCYPTPAPW